MPSLHSPQLLAAEKEMVSVNSDTHADDLEPKAIVTTRKGSPVKLEVRDDVKTNENHLASKSVFRDYIVRVPQAPFRRLAVWTYIL